MFDQEAAHETFDRARAVAAWRDAMLANGLLSEEQGRELEDHLLCSLDRFDGAGLTEEERFLVATQRLGQRWQLQDEYTKVVPWVTWKVPVYWSAVAIAWVMGIESILDLAVLTGALLLTRAEFGTTWMKAWTSVVCVGGPAATLWYVATWMKRYSTTHPASRRAVLVTVAVALVCRVGSLPLLGILHAAVWRGLAAHAAGSFRRTWEVSVWAGILLVVGATAMVMLRSPERGGLEWR